MSLFSKSITIRRPRKDWRQSWFWGLVFLFIYHYCQLNLYHFYLYFFIVGGISYINSLIPIYLISNNGLSVYWGGVFNKNDFFFNWKDIEFVKIQKVKQKVAGDARFSFVSEVEIPGLSVKLVENPSLVDIDVKSLNKSGIEFDESNLIITFFKKAEEDFETILYYISRYCDTEKKKFNEKKFIRVKRQKMIIDSSLFLIIIVELWWILI